METINHECYVSLEVAKLLKEAGFDWECPYKYERSIMACRYEDYEKPTLDVAQRWLREAKNYYVSVEVFVHDLDKNNIYYTYNWVVYFNGDRYSGSDFDTTRYYEVAQEAGIKKALELI